MQFKCTAYMNVREAENMFQALIDILRWQKPLLIFSFTKDHSITYVFLMSLPISYVTSTSRFRLKYLQEQIFSRHI